MKMMSLKPWFSQNHRHLLVKFLVGFLLMGLSFRLLFIRSSEISSKIETPFPQEIQFPGKAVDSDPPPLSLDAHDNEEQTSQNAVELPVDQEEQQVEEEKEESPETGKCDILKGDWIPDGSGPLYTNSSCRFIESHQNCMLNGRPDTGYLYWRWTPRDCILPKFDARKFLETMRNKVWALVGDSISRNHVQSLLCMLSRVEQPREVYHDKDYKSKRWHFQLYNLTISTIFSPFLVKAKIYEDINGVSTSEVQLHLDRLDKQWTDLYQDLDYMIISTGKWFLKSAVYHEDGEIIGCHECPKRNMTELGFDFAYRKVLTRVLDFVANSGHKGTIFFRTSTPDHFEDGEWSTGGTCKRTSPVKEGFFELKLLSQILREVELDVFKNVTGKASANGVDLKLLDVSSLSLLRPDGHPGPYRAYRPFARGKNVRVQNDCLHWCLPGPIDSWNDIIMEMIING